LFFTNLENILGKRGGKYFVGDKLSWAELHFFQMVEVILDNNSKVLEPFPQLTAVMERTKQVPNIRKWLEERPQTAY